MRFICLSTEIFLLEQWLEVVCTNPTPTFLFGFWKNIRQLHGLLAFKNSKLKDYLHFCWAVPLFQVRWKYTMGMTLFWCILCNLIPNSYCCFDIVFRSQNKIKESDIMTIVPSAIVPSYSIVSSYFFSVLPPSIQDN